jgi:hypothetical protein
MMTSLDFKGGSENFIWGERHFKKKQITNTGKGLVFDFFSNIETIVLDCMNIIYIHIIYPQYKDILPSGIHSILSEHLIIMS